MQAAERKTAVMRLQNRLQQSFAKRLKPGQGEKGSAEVRGMELRETWMFNPGGL